MGSEKKQSTEDPLILFLYNITETSERKECAIAIIFSDSQKAFDTCYPKNLCHMDRTGLVQQLQYFTNRRQLVSIENENCRNEKSSEVLVASVKKQTGKVNKRAIKKQIINLLVLIKMFAA